jgi:hypothetical protein
MSTRRIHSLIGALATALCLTGCLGGAVQEPEETKPIFNAKNYAAPSKVAIEEIEDDTYGLELAEDKEKLD